jgi:Transglycosylase
VPFDKRKAFFGVLIAGVAGALLFPPAIYLIGLAIAPPRPIPATTPISPVLGDAIWARANGGSATELTPISPVVMAQFAACIAIEDFKDTTPGDARRVEACRGYLPAMQGVEYLSGVHLRDANLKPSFREGLSRFATSVWMTRSWTRTELLDTLASRGEFGAGLRGAEAASRAYFGKGAGELTLPQAALLASFIGDRSTAFDPWCESTAAAQMRGRVLQRMHDDLVIDDAELSAANTSELALGPPPADHTPCKE